MAVKSYEAIYPLSAPQQGMLFECLLAPASGIHIEQTSCALHGKLDVASFKEAWARMIKRHAILRTAFVWKSVNEPLQVVLENVATPFYEEDWRSLSPAEQEERLTTYCRADRLRGFEVSQAPLMRVALFHTGEDERQLVWTYHHILMDGWCRPIVFKELLEFYNAQKQGRELDLSRPRPYRDFIAWLGQQNLADAEAFWRGTLKGFTKPTALGVMLDKPATDGQLDHYARQTVSVPAEPVALLQAQCRQHRLTMNTVVQGAWALLLSRYSGEDDVVFGATVSGRPPELIGIESTLGMFINTLPVRVRISPEESVWPWLEKIQAQNFALRQYEHSPIGQVHQWSDVPGAPLYESLLVFQNFPVEAIEDRDLTMEIADFKTKGAQTKFGVTILATLGKELNLQLISDSRRVDAESSRHMLAHMSHLLTSFVQAPDEQLHGLREQIALSEVPRIRPLQAPEQRKLKTDFVAPQTPIEEIIAGIWAQTLHLHEVSIHDNFFELGGHSLLATQLTSMLQNAFEIDLPLSALFNAPTVAELAVEVARLKSSQTDDDYSQLRFPHIAPDREHRYQPFPMTDVQEAYWVGRSASLELGNIATHNYTEADLTGLDVERLNRAWQRLIDRHDMLRAIVLPTGEQQVIETVEPYKIEVNNLSGLSEEEVKRELRAVRQRMSHQVLPTDRWPLFEIRASRLDADSVRLHISYDLLIGDAWSLRLLAQELIRCYREPDLELPEFEITFRDYIVTERAFREGERYKRAEEYWRARLESIPPAPELPLARNPASITKPHFVRRRWRVDAERWQKLKEEGTRAGLTPSGLLLAAYAEVLAHWSKRQDFTINLTLFNRLPFHPQIDEVVGDFTSLTLLAVNNQAVESFLQRARKLQQRLWEDLDHRYVSAVTVMREMARLQGTSRTSMPVVFTSVLGLTRPVKQEDRAKQPPKPEAGRNVLGEVSAYSIGQTPQVWLDLQVLESTAGELICLWDEVDGLFPTGMTEEMFAGYCDLLERLIEDDATWHESRLELESAVQVEARLRRHPPVGDVPRGLLHAGFLERAHAQPEAIAVIGPHQQLTYAQLYECALHVAHQVRDAGVGVGQLVAVQMQKGWEQVVAVLGILEAGGAYLPLSPELPQERAWQLLADAKVELVLTQSWLAEQLSWPDGMKLLLVDELSQAILAQPPTQLSPALEPPQQPDDLAYVIYTSGSTGIPKGVMITHAAALNTIVDINERFDVQPGDRVLALSSLSFDLSVYDIFGILAAGATIVLPRPFSRPDPQHWLELVREQEITVWNSVPQLLQLLVETGSSGWGESLRLVMLSGDWIPLTLPEELKREAPGARFISLGGATEASIWSNLFEVEKVEPEWKSIPYGHALKNQQMYVLNERLEECPTWVVGQLYIGGVGLALGYWADEEKTKSRFIEHPATGERLYRTGDLGRYLADGEIEFLGREDNQVKVQGHRIELGEIETLLAQHEAVEAAVVTAVGELRGNKRLAAYIVANKSFKPTAPANGNNGHLHARLTHKERLEFKLRHPGLRPDADASFVQLTPPVLDESAIEQYYVHRRSHRKITQAPLSLDQLSNMLSCLAEFKADSGLMGKYRYGSAGSLYPVQTYLWVKPDRIKDLPAGIYYYHPSHHRLVLLTPDATIDRSIHSTVNRPVFDDSAFSIFLIGQLNAITPLYGEIGKHYAAIEAGLITQLLEMSAPEHEIGLCQIGELNFEQIKPLFKLDDGHVLLHSLVGGRIEPAQLKLASLVQELTDYRSIIELQVARDVAETKTEADPDDAGTRFVDDLRSYLRERLPEYMVPSSFTVLDSLPLTPNGKVNRNALPAPESLHATVGYTAPETEVELMIAAALQDVLKVEKVSTNHNFFDLGGNSIHIVQVYNRLRALMKREFPLVAVFENPTIKSLAQYLTGEATESALRERGAARGEKRKELAQRRGAARSRATGNPG